MSVTTTTSTPWRTRAAVGAAYAAQGFGYATVVTALPGLKARTGIDDATISVVLLLGALLAAAGSVTAERVALRWSSRAALVTGLLLQAAGLALVTSATSVPPLVGAFVVFAVGLGMVDASTNMQGVLLQRLAGRSIMSTLFACLTAAAILAALAQAALANLGATTGAVVALLVAAVVAAAVALTIRSRLIPAPPRTPRRRRPRRALRPPPRPGVARVHRCRGPASGCSGRWSPSRSSRTPRSAAGARSTWPTTWTPPRRSPRSGTPPTRRPCWCRVSSATRWCAGSGARRSSG
ncbi:MFS transporter [Cellulomonas sp. JZ18]|nr:MFS transporter [Cellulomonas sp. JZ18]